MSIKKHFNKKNIFISILVLALLLYFTPLKYLGAFEFLFENRKFSNDRGYFYDNPRIFKGTPALTLAKAIKIEDLGTIERELKKNPDLLKIRVKYDNANITSLMAFAADARKPMSIRKMVEMGADPNEYVDSSGKTALYEALKADQYTDNYQIIMTLLKVGSDPNQPLLGTPIGNYDKKGATPIMIAAENASREACDLLLEYGADLNAEDSMGGSAAKYVVILGLIKKMHYFAVVKGANLKGSVSLGGEDDYSEPEDESVVGHLRKLTYEIGSEEYKMKMEVVEAFKKQGMDYWSTPIPEKELAGIKRMYPDTWEEYIKVY